MTKKKELRHVKRIKVGDVVWESRYPIDSSSTCHIGLVLKKYTYKYEDVTCYECNVLWDSGLIETAIPTQCLSPASDWSDRRTS